MTFEDALAYPRERDDWVMTILIGGVLTLFGVLLIPAILVYGYVIRAVRDSLEGETEPPKFEEWGELFVDGIQAFVVGLSYMLVPLVVMGVTVGGSLVAIATGSEAGAAAGLAGLFGGLAITAVLSLVFGYVAVAALVNFAKEGSLSAAFDFGTIRAVALDGDFAVAWATSIIVFLGAGVVVGVLNAVPLLGTVLGAFVFFYADVVAANLWADGFAQATESQREAGSFGTGEAAV
ncbi:DUF4013 domain-containing protein [Haloarculaceae archaeon H-GB2-1]|nr:DUF4013 domain-containing protein [Haloarculaceae archaeon H-GB1-1]MEA5386645.1 DUF4013 domain-containing protein [Haloarculaceae archaeon H-GB11]MEA5408169.1 DUF4013 domain-containing protein [Haloarculaceae archaeon H-GB2-1]